MSLLHWESVSWLNITVGVWFSASQTGTLYLSVHFKLSKQFKFVCFAYIIRMFLDLKIK